MLLDEQDYIWSDSHTTLHYIKNETKRFQTSPDQWRHFPGRVNPADDPSRGLNPQKLSSQHWWRRGFDFLWETEDCWPSAK